MIKKIILLLFINLVLWAQEYPIHQYSIEDGLPSNEVYDIGQDSIGVMWFTTRKGLCKYDGFQWQIDTTIEKSINFIPNFFDFDDDGKLWVCGRRFIYDIFYLEQNKWRKLNVPDSLVPFALIRYFKVTYDSDGNPFILTVTTKNKIVYYFHGKWKKVEISKIGTQVKRILSVNEYNNQFLILTEKGMFIFDGYVFKKFELPEPIKGKKILSFNVKYIENASSKGLSFLFLTPDYIYQFNDSSFKKFPLYDGVKKVIRILPIRIMEDGFGGIYLGNKFKLYHYNIYLKKWELIRNHSVPKDIDAMNIFLDQEKNLWISSFLGLFKIPTLRFLNFNEFTGLLETEVSSVNQFDNGKMIFGHDNGFTLYDGKRFKKVLIGNISAPNEQSSKRFIQLIKYRKDTIIAAAQSLGLVKIHQSGRYEIIPPPTRESVNAIAKLNESDLLIGTYRGLFKFSNNKFSPYLKELTEKLNIRRILLFSDHSMFLATNWNGIVLIKSNGEAVKIWNKKYPKSRSVYDLKLSPEGKIFAATKAGLFELISDSLIPINSKVLNKEVYTILIENNNIWLGTDRGAEVLKANGEVVHYDYFNGLAGQECNRDALFRDSNGHIWIGTIGGLSLYQPVYDFKVRPPVVKFLNYITDVDFIEQSGSSGNLIVKFLCLSFKDEHRIALRYRLKGYHDWQYISRLFTPVLSFLDIPPGNYQLEVQAKNVEGTWSPIVRSKVFNIPVPFYRSWYFIALTIFAILIISYLIIFALVKARLARRLEEEVDARTKALKKSEEKYRRLFTDSQDGIFITSIDGKVLDINEAGIKIMGYDSKEEILKLELKRDVYVDPNDRDKFLNLIKTQGYIRNFELKLKRKDGKIIDVAISSTPIYDEQGNIVALSGYFRDMTEWNAMKEQLAHSQRMESLGMLAGGVAHDFNNILAGILGYASLMKMKINPEDKLYHYIDIIEKSAQRAADLTQQLLIFSRKGQQKLQPVNVNECVKESIKLIKSTFPRTIEIETNLDKNIPEIMADPTQLSQMIINLCVNARDAMPEGEGKISFQTKEVVVENSDEYNNPDVTEGRFVQLTISDTGTGIPDEIKNKIFEPFYTTKPRGKGTGMGLAMVYGFVRNLGGFIQLYSKLNEGTTFQIHFPVKPIHMEEEPPSVKSEMKIGTERILVVDDEEMVRSFCQMALEKYGYTINLASNGEEALERFKDNDKSFDLVILDMIMPVMDGMKTYFKIREFNKDIKILISSGYSDSEKLEKLKNDPKVDVIFKPYKVQELVSKVRNLLDKK